MSSEDFYKRQCELLAEALEFYSKELKPRTAIELYSGVSPAHYDGGHRAKAALEEYKKALETQ